MPLNPSKLHNGTPVTVLRARLVLPVSSPPIEDGAIRLSGNRIDSVGRWCEISRNGSADVIDLGETILLPGLVNAHCHLDYTNMAGELAPTKGFVNWLMLITTSKSGWTYSDFAESWLAGARMLLRTGTTTVGDIEMVPELLPEVWTATPLRVLSFLEMTGVKNRRAPNKIVDDAMKKVSSLPNGRSRAGFSPHAPYSTAPKLLRLAAEAARHHQLRVATHVGESHEEFEMFQHGRGEMYDWLLRNGRDMSDCGGISPVQHLERHGALGDHLLAIHVNYLAPGDATLLAKRHVSVVHCPRSHAYFQHRPFPLQELMSAGANICLGTDSLASVYKKKRQSVELNLFEEMRALAAANPDLRSETIVQMATANGAAALGMKGHVGELAAGAFADIIAIPHEGKIADVSEAVVQHRSRLAASMIDGEWVVTSGAV
jgi:cytosine/adenosine deaminase-related metal-dependent hydrolase